MKRNIDSSGNKDNHYRDHNLIVMRVIFAAAALGVAIILGNALRFDSSFSLLDFISFSIALIASLCIFGTVLYWLMYALKDKVILSVVVVIFLSTIFISSGLMLFNFFGVNLNSAILIIISFVYFYFCSRLLLAGHRALLTVIAFIVIAVPPALFVTVVNETDPLMKDIASFDLAPDVSSVRFHTKPDVYLIGLLSASPEKILLKTLGDKNFKLERTLTEIGFKTFDHVTSEETTTRKSYDAILAMSRSYAVALSENEYTRGKQFSGNVYSPLFDIFKRNGYKISTLTEDFKFGYTKGRYIDNYIVNTPLSICSRKDMIDSMRIKFVFLGGCLVRRLKIISDFLPEKEGTTELLVESIRLHSEDQRPNLFLAHLKPPIHAPADFSAKTNLSDVEEFYDRYVSADNQAAHNIVEIFEAIQATNKDYIVLVFGDRGVGILNKINEDASSSDLVMDRKAVVASIYPAAACNDFISDAVTTTPEILKGLINCLSRREYNLTESANTK